MGTTGLNDLNDIPKAWRGALASVQLTFSDAVMAGGCLRDRELGVKVKDIDIFISTTTPGIYGAGSIKDRLIKDGWVDVAVNGDESYGDGQSARGIVAVLDMKYPGCPPVNLIAMKQFKLEEFDFGICQIMFDGKRIIRLPDYHHDLAAKQFRLIPKVKDAEFVRSLGRWMRLKEKFPEWKFHLGSRADDAPFIPPQRSGTITGYLDYASGGPVVPPIQPINMAGVTSFQQARRQGHFFRDMKDLAGMTSGEYVMPKAMAERLTKETTALLLRMDSISQTCTVHVDDRAVVPGAQIIKEMIEAKDRLARDMMAHAEAARR